VPVLGDAEVVGVLVCAMRRIVLHDVKQVAKVGRCMIDGDDYRAVQSSLSWRPRIARQAKCPELALTLKIVPVQGRSKDRSACKSYGHA
jgi:hypothetical protein